ncbi:MAG: hypothetical protein JSW52_09620 [Candidatus Coatesbacteria bacterium]|nr:MAG: hypothetical protein JSW52_09620 [Candidatus Coatesbacteria bacterium]
MKRLLVVPVMLALAAGAYGYSTWPRAFTYDGLATKDRGGLPLTPGALHLNGGFFYADLLGKRFNADGDSVDEDLKAIGIPIDLGYAIDEQWEVDITFQLLRVSNGTSNFGIGDMWFKARALFETGTDFYFGPRIAVKIPVGDDTKLLGDGQVDIDIGAVGAKYGETHFRLNGQLGFRYRLENGDLNYKPGILIYAFMEPGVGVGRANKFSFYFPIAFDYHAASTLNDVDQNDSGYGFAFGIKPAYALDQNNTLNLTFLYPVFGKNANKDLYIGFTADSFIPL